jgi:hypothetical protein
MRNSVPLRIGLGPALSLAETGLSSSAAFSLPGCRTLKPNLRSCAIILLAGAWLAAAGPVAAQDDSVVTHSAGVTRSAPETSPEASTETAPEPVPEPVRRRPDPIDLSVTVPRPEPDRRLEEDCEIEADAARIANEIIVCRQLGEATDGSWDREAWERDYARRTQGGSTPNMFGIPDYGNSIAFGSVAPPALMIDIEALPEAPEGSDADRIARGLPPLGSDPEPSPEEIAERRRALGLEAPPTQNFSE